MVPFKETINTKQELIEACKKGFEDYSNKRISKNDFCMYFGFTHGKAITTFYEGNYEQLLIDGGFNSGSGAYFAGGINAWKNLLEGKYVFPPFVQNESKPRVVNTLPLQQIFFGAPGTGKSHKIKELTEGKQVIRTTFHPDSDYSTFVGAYKPTMGKGKVYGAQGPLTDGGKFIEEPKITYCFIPQAFLRAYLGAWKKYASVNSINGGSAKKAPITFSIPNTGDYTIVYVDQKGLTLSREFDFSKKGVADEWPNLWHDGKFVIPTGPQSGKSVQHAIAKWIESNITPCSVSDFERGWSLLLDTIDGNGSLTVQKTQSYVLTRIGDAIDKVRVKVEEAGKSKATLMKAYNGTPSQFALDNTLVEMLRKYKASSFDEAWSRFKQGVDNSLTANTQSIGCKPQFLVIEEINRGNCAQIFGDLFQLLDRGCNGFSEYPIEADADLQQEIQHSFKDVEEYRLNKDINIEGAIKGYTSNYGSTLSKDVQEGRVLLLPPNFYIWATMNTSDQSLFPIDSAFKRRWEWKYIKIKNHPECNYQIKIGDEEQDWWQFITKINEIIASMTSSADKQLGYFFCKADKDGKISAETFVSKVIFYLWNDVFKDYGYEDASLFRYKDKEGVEHDLTFPDFYDEDGEKVDTERLADFLKKVQEWKKTDEKND